MIDPNKTFSRFSYKGKYFVCAFFLLLLVGVIVGQGYAGISYTYLDDSFVNDVFPAESTLVILYDNRDEQAVSAVTADLLSDEHVTSVQAYGNTLGAEMDYLQMAYVLNMGGSADVVKTLYTAYEYELSPEAIMQGIMAGEGGGEAPEPTLTISLYDFVTYLNGIAEPLLAMLPEEMPEGTEEMHLDEMLAGLQAQAQTLEQGKRQLVGATHSRMIVTIDYVPEMNEMKNFISSLRSKLGEVLDQEAYLIGEPEMSYELNRTFQKEYLFISILTAVAIFAIVCIGFRKFTIPLILVAIIECSVFITMTFMALVGKDMYFLALIIVQCILMGSMVDYGIMMSTYYIEVRGELPREEALPEVFHRSLPTILTSGLIMVSVSFILGTAMNGAVSSILTTLGIGATSALILVIFILPSLLLLLDRFTVKGREEKESAPPPVEESLPAPAQEVLADRTDQNVER